MKTQRTALPLALFLLGLAALGASAATAQTELFFATGVDSTGWAQAQSNDDGHVLIESPQYPRGLWLHLVDEAGDALTGLQVEYQGRPDSLVVLRCVDPTGGVRETLIWTRPDGTPLRLTLKPTESTDLPARVASIDWQINPIAEALLEPMAETQRINWEEVAAFLKARWQGQTGRVAVQVQSSTTSTTLAVEVEHPETIETLVAHLQQMYQPAGTSLEERPELYVQVFRGGLALQKGVILYAPLFADANLESYVRYILGRPQGRLTPEDVASLTWLWADDKDIHNLAGIEHFTALQELLLAGNQLVDLNPLAALKNLETLRLYRNQLVDLNPLAQLTNLTNLSLGYNQLVDLTPLAALKNLETLSLNDNPIVDLTPLAALKNLETLRLGNNQIVDITPLTSMTNLTSLSLGDNQIVDITPLTSMTNLTGLSIGDNQISDLTPLGQLTNLKGLGIYGNQLVDLNPLAQLTNLTSLSLNGNYIADITPLGQLTNLTNLSLYRDQIVDITPLVQLTNLTKLSLGDNQIADITPLAALKNLEELRLEYNRVVDITSLAQLTNLTRLYLYGNQIDDITPLKQLNNLKLLWLDNNLIDDITPLKQLNKLEYLRLNGNRIEDLTPLIANTSLGAGDVVSIQSNPLSPQARNEQIPVLEARGVTVRY